jgi:hypothetical protein
MAPHENSVRLDTTISDQLNTALDQMVILTGISKASLVRDALTLYLVGVGGALPSVTAAFKSTRTSGQGIARIRRRTR